MRPLSIAFILTATLSQLCSAQIAAPDRGSLEIQAQELLREAAGLVKDIPQIQQQSAAANIAGQLVRAGDLSDALATARSLKEPNAQALAMGIVAWQLAHSKQSSQALSLMESTESGQGRDVSYQGIAELLVKQGGFEEALKTAHFIKEPQRRGETLVQLAIASAKSGDSQSASRALSDALELAESSPETDPGCAMILEAIAAAQAEIGATPETAAALERLRDIADVRRQTGDGMLWQALALTEARIGNLEIAEQLAAALPASSADVVYMEISRGAAEQGSTGAAFATASKISSAELKDAAFRELAMICERNGNVNDSFEAINKVSDPSNQAEALAALALEQAENGDGRAYQSLNLSEAAAARSSAAKPNKAAEVAAVTYGVLGDFSTAGQLLTSLDDPESRTWPLWSLTWSLVKRQRIQDALALADGEQSAQPKAYALLGTAQGLLDRAEDRAESGE